MKRLAWFNYDDISQQFLRALTNQDDIMHDNVLREAVKWVLCVIPVLGVGGWDSYREGQTLIRPMF